MNLLVDKNRIEKPRQILPRLFLLRHGETDWNAVGRLQGHNDIVLNEVGRKQARRHGEVLRGLLLLLGERASDWHFVSSPLRRCRETMEIMRCGLGLEAKGYQVSEQIIELGFGDWEGKCWDDISAKMPELIAARQADPWRFSAPGGGETYETLKLRIIDWYQALPPRTIAVTHSGPSRMVRGYVAGLAEARIPLQESYQHKFAMVQEDGFVWV